MNKPNSITIEKPKGKKPKWAKYLTLDSGGWTYWELKPVKDKYSKLYVAGKKDGDFREINKPMFYLEEL